MSPVEIADGTGLLAYADDGKTIPDLNFEGVEVELVGNSVGGHIKIVENDLVKVDQDLIGSVVAEYIARNGRRFIFAGGIDKASISKALKSYQNTKLPSLGKYQT